MPKIRSKKDSINYRSAEVAEAAAERAVENGEIIDEATKATTNAGDFDRREKAKAALERGSKL